MIKNFDDVKRQLADLATVINAFKSEAVQLRIIELVLQGGNLTGRATSAPDEKTEGDGAPGPPKKAGSRRKAKVTSTTERAPSGAKTKRRGSGAGPVPTLELLINDGFFKKHQTIGQIVEHCGSSKARNFKPNEISGPLGRLVRGTRLKRQKNADGQFEYFV